MLYVTQQLAYRKYLYINQTLTGLHDKSAAWTGLGASGKAMWDYRGIFIGRHKKERPAFLGVSLILVYLVGHWLVNLVAPNLLDIDKTLGNPKDVLMLTENITQFAQSRLQCVIFHHFPSFLNLK